MSVHALEAGNCLLVMKGAPERILERCQKILVNDESADMTDRWKSACDAACLELAAKGNI